MGSATYKNGGRHKWQHKYTVYTRILYTGAAPGFWFEGETSKKKFIHEFLSSSVLQWHFGLGDIQQKSTHQRLLKNFEKFIKEFAQKFKNSPKFFKNKI